MIYTYQGRAVEVVFNSRIARILGIGRINNCVTLSRKTIRVSRDWIGRKTLAHEWGHTAQAARLGWRYLPWVLWTYRKGYAASEAERDADRFMDAHWQDFTALGPVPAWVVEA